MIKFEEHDDKLFLMLDKPVPLTPDAEMPCLVRFRMPFSERFMGKHEGVAFFCDAIKKNPLYGNRLYAFETRRVGCIAEPKELEIIGTLVAEGSKEWAWYQMMKGEKVRYDEMISQRFCAIKKGCDYCAFYESDGNEISINTRRTYGEFMEYSKMCGILNWRIYKEPKPESENIIHGHIPADMHLKYIDLVRYKVGDSVICEYHRSPLPKQISYERVIDVDDVTVITQSQNGSVCAYDINGNHGDINGWHIDRVISPCEHIVTIGCLSGTVRPVSTNGIHIWFHLIGVDDKTIATIRISSLDTQTRELVESLLEAQEEVS